MSHFLTEDSISSHRSKWESEGQGYFTCSRSVSAHIHSLPPVSRSLFFSSLSLAVCVLFLYFEYTTDWRTRENERKEKRRGNKTGTCKGKKVRRFRQTLTCVLLSLSLPPPLLNSPSLLSSPNPLFRPDSLYREESKARDEEDGWGKGMSREEDSRQPVLKRVWDYLEPKIQLMRKREEWHLRHMSDNNKFAEFHSLQDSRR